MTPCPTDEALAAYGLGKLSTANADAVYAHLERCGECRARVAELSADSFVGALRGGRKRAASGDEYDGVSAAVRAAAPDDRPPEVPAELLALTQYTDLKELGRGGMGVVYVARNTDTDRLEVLKVVQKAGLAGAGAVERFVREIRAACKLKHRNVVTGYTVLRSGDLIVFVMEFVPGQDLAKLVQARGPLPVPVACSYVRAAALGLQHAHGHGMVHRDIKPGNLILTREDGKPMVKVLDFGLAKVVAEEGAAGGGLTGDHRMMGTPHYMAPEQAEDAARADTRADVYALGCTLFFLLAGRPPFDGDSFLKIIDGHRLHEPPRLDVVQPTVPAELAAVVGRLLAKDPARRFQTPGEVAEALLPFVSLPVPKSPPSVTPTAPPVTGETSRPGETAGDRFEEVAPQFEEVPMPPASHWRPPSVFRDGPVPNHTAHLNPEDFIPRPGSSALKPRRPKVKVEPQRRRPRWLLPAVVTAALVAGLAGAWGLAVLVKTPHGTIVVENVPDGAEVTVDGSAVTVTRNGDAVTVSAVKGGQHKLRVTQGGKELLAKDDVVVTVGGQPFRVRVEAPVPAPAPPPAVASVGPAGAVVSRFAENDNDGWTTRNINGDSSTAEAFEVRSFNGKFHLYGRGRDMPGSWGFVAPPKFHGNQSDKFGGVLRYHIYSDKVDPAEQIVYAMVRSPGGALIGRGAGFGRRVTPGVITTFEVKLDETGGWHGPGMTPITNDQVRKVLADVTGLWIRGQYATGPCESRLGTVELLPPVTPAPAPPPDTALFPVGSTWSGTYYRTEVGVPKPLHVTVRLTVQERAADRFAAVCVFHNGAATVVVAGTVSPDGSIKCRYRERLSGTWRQEIIDRATAVGSVKGGLLNLIFTCPDPAHTATFNLTRDTK